MEGIEVEFALLGTSSAQNFTRSQKVLSAARFGLSLGHKSIKGDYLPKMKLSDLVKSIFGHS